MSDGRGVSGFFTTGRGAAWATALVLPALAALTFVLIADVAAVRYRRDVTRMGFNDNLELLEAVNREVGVTTDTLHRVLAIDDAVADKPYVVVSLADHRLWFKRGDEVIFTTRVATGTGKNLEQAGGKKWKFETPRGRLVVERKDVEPAWVPPDWHYVEVAKKKGLRVVHLERGKKLSAGNGAYVDVQGTEIVMHSPGGRETPMEVREGQELQVGRALVIPPYGTSQRKYVGTLGSNRLYLGDGYGIHGTDAPTSIGRDASHGCVRVRNEDAELLFRIVPVGTAVYIY